MVNNDDDPGNFLQLNVTKTKDLCIDFRRKQTPVCIKGEEVVRDYTYKYLGIVIYSKLNWNENTESLRKNVSRMYCLRKLKKFGVSADLLIFYNAVISSTISFGAACWGGNVSKYDQGRVDKVIHRGSCIVGRQLPVFVSRESVT